MKNKLRASCICLLLCLSSPAANSSAQQILGSRWIKITLIPDYVNGTIEFDAQIDLGDLSRDLDLDGLPLLVDGQWKAEESSIWNLTGSIRDGKITHEPPDEEYLLLLGTFLLQPNDRLSLVLPFVNLDYTQIEPRVDQPDVADEYARQRTHLFTYSAGEIEREIRDLTIPFTPVDMKAELAFVPLVGEALAGSAGGLRLYGTVRFENIKDFEEFSRYCQIEPDRIKKGDFRVGHLLYNLDFPAYFGPDVLNLVYENKPTRVLLRSQLSMCQYDKDRGVGRVQAAFSGRVSAVTPEMELFPRELSGRDFPDGNYSFSPEARSKGVQGYVIRLGKILLAPGDELTITIPNAQVQANVLQPSPSAYENTGVLRITYIGPKSFELVLPYVPQSNLYGNQFPSIVRPSILLIEDQLQNFYPLDRSGSTWIALGLGLLLLLLSRSLPNVRWLFIAGWLLVALGCFYGVRGSFGLLCAAVAFYTARASIPGSTSTNRVVELQEILKGLACFALIAVAVYFDSEGTSYFRNLSGSELSPLTPLILMILVGALFLVLYGKPDASRSIARSDLPILILFLTVLSLYDAFDKSLLALLIFFTGGLIILRHASRSKGSGARQDEGKLGNGLRRRWKLAFGNRIVLLAMLVLVIFAVLNDLSSTYANEMQVLLPPLIAPLAIPLLVFVSVFLTFSSIALLFILVYPFIPLKTGYLKAAVFALVLFLVFLFGIGTDDRLIASLPNILVGRVVYYVSVPMLIGAYLDINEFMQKENKRRSTEDKDNQEIDFRTASSLYFKNLRGILGTLAGVVSLVAPTLYAFLSSQPVILTYFDLLEKLILLPG